MNLVLHINGSTMPDPSGEIEISRPCSHRRYGIVGGPPVAAVTHLNSLSCHTCGINIGMKYRPLPITSTRHEDGWLSLHTLLSDVSLREGRGLEMSEIPEQS